MMKGSRKQSVRMTADGGDNRPPTEKQPLTAEEGFYDIEAILKKRIRKGAPQYLIKWLGYPEEQNTWEPLENLHQCSYWVEEFEKSLKASRRRRQKDAASTSIPCVEAQDGTSKPYIKLTTGYLAQDIDVSAGSSTTDPYVIVKISKPISCQTEEGISVIFTAKRANGSECTVTNKFLKAHYPDLLMDFYHQYFVSHYYKI